MAAIGLALEFLWEFLEPLLSDAIKERIKPRDSSDTAKKLAFRLYRVLGDVNQKTDTFVDEMRGLVLLVSTTSSDHEIRRASYQLEEAARELMYGLPELAKALDNVNPQLEVHKHELVQKIADYMNSRAAVLTELEENAERARNEQAETLQRLLNTAEKNRKLINKATQAMRDFLAKEFPFKDSF